MNEIIQASPKGIEIDWLNSHHPSEVYSITWNYNARKDLYEIGLYGTFGEGVTAFDWRAEAEIYAEYVERAPNKDEFLWNILDGLQEEGIQIAINLLTGRDQLGY